MARIIDATDNFNRADSADLGASWDGGYTGHAGQQIISNDVQGNTGSGAICIETHTAALENDQWAGITIANFDDSGGTIALGVMVRFSAPASADGYWLFARSGANNTQLYRVDAGALTSLALVANPGWVNGDKLSLEIIGTTLTAYRNGSTFGLSATDPNFASGRSGIITNAPTGLTANAQLDDFEAGHFGAGGGAGGGLTVAGVSGLDFILRSAR